MMTITHPSCRLLFTVVAPATILIASHRLAVSDSIWERLASSD